MESAARVRAIGNADRKLTESCLCGKRGCPFNRPATCAAERHKVIFNTRKSARRHARRIPARYTRLRAYRCPHFPHFHLTSQPTSTRVAWSEYLAPSTARSPQRWEISMTDSTRTRRNWEIQLSTTISVSAPADWTEDQVRAAAEAAFDDLFTNDTDGLDHVDSPEFTVYPDDEDVDPDLAEAVDEIFG